MVAFKVLLFLPSKFTAISTRWFSCNATPKDRAYRVRFPITIRDPKRCTKDIGPTTCRPQEEDPHYRRSASTLKRALQAVISTQLLLESATTSFKKKSLPKRGSQLHEANENCIEPCFDLHEPSQKIVLSNLTLLLSPAGKSISTHIQQSALYFPKKLRRSL